MKRFGKDEQGAALLITLLFMMLTMILITTMLASSSGEIAISGLHRDGVLALELAQAGVQEAMTRIGAGRPFATGFISSLNPGVSVSVVRRVIGSQSAYDEIQATATVGRATRRLSALVLQRSILLPPNITFADSVTEQGNGQINSGDAYARTFIVYKQIPTPGLTYTGWRINKVAPGAVPYCYTNAQCAASGWPNWYPATRRAESQATSTGADILAQTMKCPAGGGGSLPPGTINGILANDPTMTVQTGLPVYGFDTDNTQAVSAALPCGLPYKLVAQTFTDDQGITRTILFKSIVEEQWFLNYWQFDEGLLAWVKTATLQNNPQYGAVPPFPDTSQFAGNYDQIMTGGGAISGGTLGTPSTPQAILLTSGDWQLNGNATGVGTLVVNGNLTINGTFLYTGTVIVTGTFVQGAGTANITGGLIAAATLNLTGNFSVNGGGTVPNTPLGPAIVTMKTWWER